MLRTALRRRLWKFSRDKPTSPSPSTASASLLKNRFAIRAQDRLHRGEPDHHASGIPDFSEAIYSTSPVAPVQVETDVRIRRGAKGLAGGLGVCRVPLANFLDHAAAESCAAEAANGLQIVFAVNNGEPGYAVIEH